MIWPFVAVPVLLACAISAIVGNAILSDRRLQRWAADRHHQLVRFDERSAFTGPFAFAKTKLQLVYRVETLDEAGHRRRGFVRVGGPFTGALSDAVDVVWDQEAGVGNP